MSNERAWSTTTWTLLALALAPVAALHAPATLGRRRPVKRRPNAAVAATG